MVFSSLIFLYAFFPICLGFYTLCKGIKAQNVCLLFFSLLFYAWGEPKYVLLLLLMTFFDWIFAIQIEKTAKRGTNAKVYLFLSCIVNLGLIGFFKYSGMICSAVGVAPAFLEDISLPLGISFYTFQLLTYVIDVYRGEARAEREYWHVLLYASLFHQCIAGPIVRYGTIREALFERRSTKISLSQGIYRFSSGLAKKVVLANHLGFIADRFLLTDSAIAGNLSGSLSTIMKTSAGGLWLGLICYSLQIYFDFSAYSDMAIGMGQMIGLPYPENFNYPYISRSVTEFWRRWHISLGTFFRDYVYIPMGGNRKGFLRQMVNLFVVWALTGLWHGASWNFVLWGLYFFIFVVFEKLFGEKILKQQPILSHIYLLLVVAFGWLLFRFPEMLFIPAVLRGLFCANGNPMKDFLLKTTFESNRYFLLVAVIAATPAFSWISGKLHSSAKVIWEVFNYGILPIIYLLVSTALLVGETYNPFLYFRF